MAAAALLGMGGCSVLLDFDELAAADAGMDATPAAAPGRADSEGLEGQRARGPEPRSGG